MNKKILLTVVAVFSLSALVLSQKVDMGLFGGFRPRNIGPAGPSGRVTAITSDPVNTSVMYIGTASGGLWKTVNAGTTFFPVFDEQPVLSIGSVAVDPLRHDVI
jgi:hypothetical protein